MSSKSVLLLDGQSLQSLPFMKSLRKQGYRVTIFCDTKLSYGYYSRYSDERLIAPKWSEDPKGFSDFFFGYLKRSPVDVVIPLNDDSAVFLSQNLEQVHQYTQVVIPEYDCFVQGFEKNRLMDFCREHGFPHPVTADLEQVKEDEAVRLIGFPSILKPNVTTGARGMTLLSSAEEFKRVYPSVREQYGPCHLQQYIKPGGRQFCVQLYFDQDQTRVYTILEKIRFYPESGGSSCCCASIVDNGAVETCFNVLEKLNWRGFAEFDLIEDPLDGEMKIIEINPRITACIRASFASGVDFSEVIVNHALGSPIPEYTYQPGKYLRYFGLELAWFLKSKSRFRTKPGWFKFFGRDIVYQDGSPRDPLPFMVGLFSGILKQMNPEFRKSKSGLKPIDK